jgi:hypothetical protein
MMYRPFPGMHAGMQATKWYTRSRQMACLIGNAHIVSALPPTRTPREGSNHRETQAPPSTKRRARTRLMDIFDTRPRVGPGSPFDPGLRLGKQEGWGLLRGTCFPTKLESRAGRKNSRAINLESEDEVSSSKGARTWRKRTLLSLQNKRKA